MTNNIDNSHEAEEMLGNLFTLRYSEDDEKWHELLKTPIEKLSTMELCDVVSRRLFMFNPPDKAKKLIKKACRAAELEAAILKFGSDLSGIIDEKKTQENDDYVRGFLDSLMPALKILRDVKDFFTITIK
jgi:hypothetical protein